MRQAFVLLVCGWSIVSVAVSSADAAALLELKVKNQTFQGKLVARNGDYFVLGRMLLKAVVGPYFFAYLVTTQVTGLIALNLRHVLFPVMTRMVDHPARQAQAINRSIRLLTLVATPASMLVALAIGPLEQLIYRGEWAAAVPLVKIFALVAPILMLTDVSHAALLAKGRFRTSGLLTLAEAIWFTGSAWFAATMEGPDITRVALWIFGLQIIRGHESGGHA